MVTLPTVSRWSVEALRRVVYRDSRPKSEVLREISHKIGCSEPHVYNLVNGKRGQSYEFALGVLKVYSPQQYKIALADKQKAEEREARKIELAAKKLEKAIQKDAAAALTPVHKEATPSVVPLRANAVENVSIPMEVQHILTNLTASVGRLTNEVHNLGDRLAGYFPMLEQVHKGVNELFDVIDELDVPRSIDREEAFKDKDSEDVLSASILNLECSVKTTNLLENAGFKTIGDVVRKSASHFLLMKNFGPVAFEEVKKALEVLGLEFTKEPFLPGFEESTKE
jgi:hypothetical protein